MSETACPEIRQAPEKIPCCWRISLSMGVRILAVFLLVKNFFLIPLMCYHYVNDMNMVPSENDDEEKVNWTSFLYLGVIILALFDIGMCLYLFVAAKQGKTAIAQFWFCYSFVIIIICFIDFIRIVLTQSTRSLLEISFTLGLMIIYGCGAFLTRDLIGEQIRNTLAQNPSRSLPLIEPNYERNPKIVCPTWNKPQRTLRPFLVN